VTRPPRVTRSVSQTMCGSSMRCIGFALYIAASVLSCRPAEPPRPATLVDPGSREMHVFDAPPLVAGSIAGTVDTFLVESDLYAACLVGVQALQAHWREQGVELTPHELTVRHREVGCRRVESGMIKVTFFPATLQVGGSITYYVDPNQLKVVETVYGR